MKKLIILLLTFCLFGCAGHEFPVPSDFGLPELQQSNCGILLNTTIVPRIRHLTR